VVYYYMLVIDRAEVVERNQLEEVEVVVLTAL
jgi:hypothetical protein